MNIFSTPRLIAALTLSAAAIAVHAQSFKLGDIDIGHPYARPAREGQQVGGGYLKLANKGAADRLLSATSPAAGSVEIHTMSMEGDVMKMRQVTAIDLPNGQTVELKPGGHHLMLMGLKAPLKPGDKFPLTLRFEKAGEIVVTVSVEEPKPGAGGMADHKH